ncbi:MAG TPA: AAA family ATPase [Planctomycetota bacterium]|nr:AAA family ATPase [Planctomycetota bacterium]
MTERMGHGDAARLLEPAVVAEGRGRLQSLRDALGTVLLGQDDLLDLVTVALAARGHLLLEGLPGLGKTELVKSLGTLLGLSFRRIQFTPDLLPSDITGGPILQESGGKRSLVFQPGPLFANVVLADEINRASPKTQSALLEAMQERRVTVLGETHTLPEPFFVLATQNPIELEGTYPLPEAQLDRFLFKADVPTVGEDVMTRILLERRRGAPPALSPVLSAEALAGLFATVDRVFLPPAVASFASRLVAATRPASALAPPDVRRFVRYGASPRAAIALVEAGRALALLRGRPHVDFADVARLARPAIAHRLVLDHAARLEGVTAARVVASVVDATDPVGRPLPAEIA